MSTSYKKRRMQGFKKKSRRSFGTNILLTNRAACQ